MRPLFQGLCSVFLLASALLAQSTGGDRIERLLAELSNAPAPSGFEGPVREIVQREFRPPPPVFKKGSPISPLESRTGSNNK